MRAIEHGHKVLDWQENLMADEVPPEWMWPFQEELELWFEEVQHRRDEKWGTNSGDVTAPMMSNEYADSLR
jgi:hypothetical protein